MTPEELWERQHKDIGDRLLVIETHLKQLIELEKLQNGRIEKNAAAIDILRMRLAYGIGFAGGLAVVWTVVTTLYHMLGKT